MLEEYMADVTEDSFKNDSKVVDAAVRRLEILGEAARHLAPEYRAQHDTIRWQDIADFRNVLIHEYFAVDLDIVWTILTVELPQLKEQLLALGE